MLPLIVKEFSGIGREEGGGSMHAHTHRHTDTSFGVSINVHVVYSDGSNVMMPDKNWGSNIITLSLY